MRQVGRAYELWRKACGPRINAGRETLHVGMPPVYDGHAQAVGIPHGPPEERPLPTSRSVLTRPASAVRAAPGAGRAGGAPALPDPQAKTARRSIVPSMSWFVVRGLIVHSRATVRPS